MLAFQLKATLCWVAAVPVPVKPSVVGELVASLEKESVAVAVPDAAGANVTAKETVCPALRVVGTEIPETANSLLLTPKLEIVTDDPVALSVPFIVPFAPTTMLPKLRLAGESDSCPCDVPVPESAILKFELSAVDVMVSFPAAEPVAIGANVTVNVTLCFGESVTGKLSPLTEKLELLRLACEMVTVAPPPLVNVSERFALLFFCTLLNDSVADDATKVELAGAGGVLDDMP